MNYYIRVNFSQTNTNESLRLSTMEKRTQFVSLIEFPLFVEKWLHVSFRRSFASFENVIVPAFHQAIVCWEKFLDDMRREQVSVRSTKRFDVSPDCVLNTRHRNLLSMREDATTDLDVLKDGADFDEKYALEPCNGKDISAEGGKKLASRNTFAFVKTAEELLRQFRIPFCLDSIREVNARKKACPVHLVKLRSTVPKSALVYFLTASSICVKIFFFPFRKKLRRIELSVGILPNLMKNMPPGPAKERNFQMKLEEKHMAQAHKKRNASEDIFGVERKNFFFTDFVSGPNLSLVI